MCIHILFQVGFAERTNLVLMLINGQERGVKADKDELLKMITNYQDSLVYIFACF